jgi:hypothetical protein
MSFVFEVGSQVNARNPSDKHTAGRPYPMAHTPPCRSPEWCGGAPISPAFLPDGSAARLAFGDINPTNSALFTQTLRILHYLLKSRQLRQKSQVAVPDQNRARAYQGRVGLPVGDQHTAISTALGHCQRHFICPCRVWLVPQPMKLFEPVAI